MGLYAQSNLIAGGDFDLPHPQNNELPDLWSFSQLDMTLTESASYSANKGWRYVAVTAQAGGKMMNYRVNDEMNVRYNCIRATTPAKYIITFWAKSDASNTIKIHIPWYDADGKSSNSWTSPAIQMDGGVWKQYTVYTAAAPGKVSPLTASAGLEVWFETSNGIVSFDDFVVTTDTENHKAGEIVVEGEEASQHPDAAEEITGVSTPLAEKAQLSIGKGKLFVNATEPVKVTVFDVSGKIVHVATVAAHSTISLNQSAYWVKVDNKVHKVVVK